MTSVEFTACGVIVVIRAIREIEAEMLKEKMKKTPFRMTFQTVHDQRGYVSGFALRAGRNGL